MWLSIPEHGNYDFEKVPASTLEKGLSSVRRLFDLERFNEIVDGQVTSGASSKIDYWPDEVYVLGEPKETGNLIFKSQDGAEIGFGTVQFIRSKNNVLSISFAKHVDPNKEPSMLSLICQSDVMEVHSTDTAYSLRISGDDLDVLDPFLQEDNFSLSTVTSAHLQVPTEVVDMLRDLEMLENLVELFRPL